MNDERILAICVEHGFHPCSEDRSYLEAIRAICDAERSDTITDCLKIVNAEIDNCKSIGSSEVYAANRVWRAIDALRAKKAVGL